MNILISSIRFIVFTFSFLFIVNRSILYAFIEGLLHRKIQNNPPKDITEKSILNFIYKKTGLKLSKILLFDTDKLWGMMAGFPPKPYMVVSTDAIKRLDKNEMEWLYLHEAGHFVLWHNTQMVLLQLLFIIIGSVVLMIIHFNNFLLDWNSSILLSIVFSIIYFQIARYFEYQASAFALQRISNPYGIVTLAKKAKIRWFGNRKEKSIYHQLFNTWIYDIYVNLVKFAKVEIKNRSKIKSII